LVLLYVLLCKGWLCGWPRWGCGLLCQRPAPLRPPLLLRLLLLLLLLPLPVLLL
jgi:hypothetical protein